MALFSGLAESYHRVRTNAHVRLGLFWLGIVLMLLSPLLGVLPGPGFIIVFPLGLALALQNSTWAKRIYARSKRRWPKHGAWTDWALRRASAKRRLELEKQRGAAESIGSPTAISPGKGD